jgi:hypothetical protein
VTATVNGSAPPSEESPVNPILAAGTWPTNGHLIADIARLGYLQADWTIWDPTYGHGTWWTQWQPTNGHLHRTDIDPAKSPDWPDGLDLTDPTLDSRWDAITLDPPYKLNGTDQGEGGRYGVAGQYRSVEARHGLMARMLERAATLTRPAGTVLFKVQDQVNAGKVRWQTRIFADHGETVGLELVDSLNFPGYRPQPAGRRQLHARRNYSTLLVFTKQGR